MKGLPCDCEPSKDEDLLDHPFTNRAVDKGVLAVSAAPGRGIAFARV